MHERWNRVPAIWNVVLYNTTGRQTIGRSGRSAFCCFVHTRNKARWGKQLTNISKRLSEEAAPRRMCVRCGTFDICPLGPNDPEKKTARRKLHEISAAHDENYIDLREKENTLPPCPVPPSPYVPRPRKQKNILQSLWVLRRVQPRCTNAGKY